MKYMGSKSRIAKSIVPIIQKYIDDNDIKTYIEPFVGGGNVIDKINCENRKGYDKNRYLVELLKYARDINNYPADITKEEYSAVRNCYNNKTKQYDEYYVGLVGFLASCKGRFFDGGYSGTRIGSNGKVRNYYDEAKRNLEKQSANFEGVDFYNIGTYSDVIIEKGSVVYCDPPYKDTKQYDTSKGFNHDDFWNWVREISEKNIVIVSELQAPEDFECIWQQPLKIAMNNDTSKINIEKLFIHKALCGEDGF